MLNNRCKKGFTLIELLVVVLIIGILAAIAVPQYQQAIIKSQYATLKPLVQSIYQAEELYYSMHRSYAPQLDLLEIGMPTPDRVVGNTYYYPWGSCTLEVGTYSSFYCRHTKSHVGYVQYFKDNPLFKGERICRAYNLDAAANKFCKKETGSSSAEQSANGTDAYSGYRYRQ